MTTFDIEKSVWTELDFDAMGWHDCWVHALAFDAEGWSFTLDLDYIFKWVEPTPPEENYKFWICPSTMVFKDSHSLKTEINSAIGSLEIDDLHQGKSQENPHTKKLERKYRFECQEGSIEIYSTGYELVARQPPFLRGSQTLTLLERGGICFDRAPFDV